MKSDTKILITIIVLIIIVVVVQKVDCGGGDGRKAKLEPSNQEDFADIISESEKAFDDAPVVDKSISNSPKDGYVVSRNNPSDEKDYYTNVETNDFEYETNPYLSTEDQQVENETESSNYEGSSEAEAVVASVENTEAKQRETALALERMKKQEFLRELSGFVSLNMSATQARKKAQAIRERAASLREQANGADSEIRTEMLSRADLMQSYANRLSATRENKTKIRILVSDIQHNIN